MGKGVGQGGKAGARRSVSPTGADGRKPLLGWPKTKEGTEVRGRTPIGSRQGCSDRRQQPSPGLQPRRYADVARAGRGEEPLGRAPLAGTQKGKGGPTTASEGKGRQEEADGFTTVDHRAGKKPRVQQAPAGGEGRGEPTNDGADGRDDDHDWTTGPAEFNMDDERQWDEDGLDDDGGWDGHDHEYGDDGGEYERGEYQGQEEAWEDEDAGYDPEWDLDKARQETRERRELYAHLRATLGRNHVHTKRAHGGLVEAEQREREIRGPRNYWQEGRKIAKRKAALQRLLEKWDAEYDEAEQRFQEEANRHEERQQDLRERITDAKRELREIQEKEDAHAQLQEKGEAGGGPKDEMVHRALRDTAQKLAAIIEAVGTGEIEQGTEQLNLLSAQLGCALHQLPRQHQEGVQHRGKGEDTKGGSRGPNVDSARKGDTPSSGRWRGKGQDGTSGGEAPGRRTAGPRDAEEDRREAKLAARARGEGSLAAMETGPEPGGERLDTAGVTTAAAEAARQAAAEAEDRKKKRALDVIRGRVQQEKDRRLAEKQRELIAAGLLPEPHEWTEEQLRQNQRQVEISNAEVDAEVEREFAAMSSEAIAKLLEAAAR